MRPWNGSSHLPADIHPAPVTAVLPGGRPRSSPLIRLTWRGANKRVPSDPAGLSKPTKHHDAPSLRGGTLVVAVFGTPQFGPPAPPGRGFSTSSPVDYTSNRFTMGHDRIRGRVRGVGSVGHGVRLPGQAGHEGLGGHLGTSPRRFFFAPTTSSMISGSTAGSLPGCMSSSKAWPSTGESRPTVAVRPPSIKRLSPSPRIRSRPRRSAPRPVRSPPG